MLYCFNGKSFEEHKIANDDIEYSKLHDTFIYYDETTNSFYDKDDNKVEIANQMVMPVSFVNQLPSLIKALQDHKALIPNTLENIEVIKEWYKYIETKRAMIFFEGKDLRDDEFIRFISEYFSHAPELFLKTKNKDFNGIIDSEELLNSESDLRKAFTYHEDEEFILSEKVNVNYDELGEQEYRVFVYKNRIMNISRVTDTTYHRIPQSLIEYVEELLISLPKSFPKTFVVDIFSYQSMYDIVEFNPIEASGKYLYNSIFSISEDLTHKDIEKVPPERDRTNLSYDTQETLIPSTLKRINGTFSKDYEDIKRYGKRYNGFIHIHGLPEGTKINIDDFFANATLIESDSDIKSEEKKLSLTNPNS